jgi:hypothetical protein
MAPIDPSGLVDPPWLAGEGLGWAAAILDSHALAFVRPLLAGVGPGDGLCARQRAQELFAAPLVVLAHDGGADPRLTYANAAALRLWRCPWRELVGMPSRLTAEPARRPERAAALALARQRTALRGYTGIRIDSRGGRFSIRDARIWSVGAGQAAAFDNWCRLPE